MNKNKKIIMTKGLPASGKSTWAKEQVLNSKGKYIRINKDDLRSMLHSGKHSKDREREVINIRDDLIEYYMNNNKNIIIDDTNFNPIHEKRIREIIDSFNKNSKVKYELEIKFFDVPLKTCIERDKCRENPVGEKAIRHMYNLYLRKPPEYKKFEKDLPVCVICDIDGTLAHMKGRSPYDYTKVDEDELDENVKRILDIFRLSVDKVILLSGRQQSANDLTIKWLKDNKINYDYLFMRETNDNRPDYLIKEELYNKYIKDKYNVVCVLDDRNQVVNMWRRIGLKCLQVEEGDF